MRNREATPLGANALYLSAILLLVAVNSVTGLALRGGGTVAYYVALGLAEILLAMVPALIYVAARGLPMAETFHFRKTPARQIVVAALLPIAGYPVLMYINTAWMGFLMLLGIEPLGTELPGLNSGIGILMALLSVGLAPALAEEMLFRGPILAGYKRHGKWFAVCATGVLFALMHGQLEGVWSLAALGILLGLMTWESGSIWPSVVFHFMNNAVAVLLSAGISWLTRNVPQFAGAASAEVTVAQAAVSTWTLLPFAVLGGLAFWGLWVLFRRGCRGGGLRGGAVRPCQGWGVGEWLLLCLSLVIVGALIASALLMGLLL